MAVINWSVEAKRELKATAEYFDISGIFKISNWEHLSICF